MWLVEVILGPAQSQCRKQQINRVGFVVMSQKPFPHSRGRGSLIEVVTGLLWYLSVLSLSFFLPVEIPRLNHTSTLVCVCVCRNASVSVAQRGDCRCLSSPSILTALMETREASIVICGVRAERRKLNRGPRRGFINTAECPFWVWSGQSAPIY